jgi:hypothetical protein
VTGSKVSYDQEIPCIYGTQVHDRAQGS